MDQDTFARKRTELRDRLASIKLQHFAHPLSTARETDPMIVLAEIADKVPTAFSTLLTSVVLFGGVISTLTA